MPPLYIYQANAALPPLAPRDRNFHQDQSVSNPFALNTDIEQPPEKTAFSNGLWSGVRGVVGGEAVGYGLD